VVPLVGRLNRWRVQMVETFMTACGLDFGTSNTTLGTFVSGSPALVSLEDDEVTIPSAIFFTWTGEALIGRAAVQA
jgi:hypothetical chaperone protein